MKKAFTLIELLITVVVMAILMGIVFKLTGMGGDSWRRTATIVRLQRLENCLSGYNAAFGTYPPVALHGSRRIDLRVDDYGIQEDNVEPNLNWDSVQAASRAQPVGCNFPYPTGNDFQNFVKSVAKEMDKRADKGKPGNIFENYRKRKDSRNNIYTYDGLAEDNRFGGDAMKLSDWRDIQVFRFGLMSYLLPRYIIMMKADRGFYSFRQWEANNKIPADPFKGDSYSSWESLKDDSTEQGVNNQIKILNIPSQAVCARWIPNLEGICMTKTTQRLFGVSITDEIWPGGELHPDRWDIPVYRPVGKESQLYVLDGITVVDGWCNEFYYYSPPPYQTYQIWSAGPNRKTFPPWVDRESDYVKNSSEKIADWTVDDYIKLSN